MKDLLVPIDPAGRIVLPKDVRDELAVKPGDVFKVSVRGNEVTLTPDRHTAGFVRRGKALVFSADSGESLVGARVNEIIADEHKAGLERSSIGLVGARRRK